MFEEFFIRAMISGVALAFVAGPIGCFILWKRLAYFGDTLAHSALLGVAISIGLGIDALPGVFLIALAVSFVLITLRRTELFSGDTALGIISHSALAIGLIAITFATPGSIHLNTLLFGDILAVSWSDVGVSIGVALVVLVALTIFWKRLLAYTFSPDIAVAEGLGNSKSEVALLVLCSALVAIAMKVTGVLLISALLILPAATSRIFSRSPEQMALAAAFVAVICVIAGLFSSLNFDLPTGPAIILAATILFAGAMILKILGSKY